MAGESVQRKKQHREDESGINFVGRNNPGQAG
jgi:hypothetical protein